MKISLNVKKTKHLKKKLQKLKKKVNDFDKQSVYVGYYADQGIHEESSISYVDLMSIHEFGAKGDGVNIPPRPVLHLTMSGGMFTQEDKRAITKAFTGVFVKDIPISRTLNMIGSHYQDKGQYIFGSTALLPTVRGNPPLIDTGDLLSKFMYRTSLTYKAG